jgi:hypothetical protein
MRGQGDSGTTINDDRIAQLSVNTLRMLAMDAVQQANFV